VDLLIGLVILLALAFYYGLRPTSAAVALPIFLVMLIGAAMGVGLWLSALNVQYRDVGYLTPFLAQIWFYVTPVVYPLSLIPEKWRLWTGLNPMVAVTEGFRWALLAQEPPPAGLLVLSASVVVILLVSGTLVFRRMERSFADVV
jgi:lipopolysaccharide transport system permease protein